MSKTLVIVESPAKGKTIEKYLGPGYTVRASFGHVRDLPKGSDAVDIEKGFKPKYVITPKARKTIKELKEQISKADFVILATDPDREGEAISWHLAEALKLTAGKYQRIEFHEITKEAITNAVKHPRDIDKALVDAQQARRVLDRLAGYDLSQLVWKKVRYGLSAGRVQSPALRIIMEREREIRAFEPVIFWTVTAETKTGKNEKLTLTATEEPRDEKRLVELMKLCCGKEWQVIDLSSNEAKRAPKPPFTTSTLQQAASTRLGFSPSRTMSIAQKLYEKGLITYMRTDSTNLSQTALGAIHQKIATKFGKEFLAPHKYKTQSKNAQEAHEAIRPTNFDNEPMGSDEESRLYKLIWQRTVASQMADAKFLRTKISVKPEENTTSPIFTANGNQIVFEGWLAADPEAKGDDVILPEVKIGEKLIVTKLDSLQKQTEPPNRYTEAGLIKELEKRGIGRPSTYASIMKTLEERGYVTKQGRTLFPTDTGDVVSTFLENHFAKYISDTFTAEMEDELDEVSNGKLTYLKLLQDFYGPFHTDVQAAIKEVPKQTDLGSAPADITCPKCGSPMIVKLGKSGKFLSCSNYPECTGALTMEGKEMEGPRETGEICPECGKGNLVEREGRYGKFISCSNYPKCRYIAKTDEQKQSESTGVQCPVCKAGEMVEKRGRYGIFYACSNYPKCKHAIKSKPTGNLCDSCGALMMEGTKTIPERCSDKNCPNHNPHKK